MDGAWLLLVGDGAAVDDALGDVSEFYVLPLGRPAQQVERVVGGELWGLGHEHPLGLFADGPALHGLGQLLTEVVSPPVGRGVASTAETALARSAPTSSSSALKPVVVAL